MSDTYGYSMSGKDVREYTKGFGFLSDRDREIALSLAHGMNLADVAAQVGLSKTMVHRRKEAITASLRCAPNDLPRAVLAAVGVIGAYSI